MDRKTSLPAIAALLLLGLAGVCRGAEPLTGEATAVISVMPASLPEPFRLEWLQKERALEDEFRRKDEEADRRVDDEIADLREGLQEGEEELRKEFADDLEELREEFKEKRSDVLSSRGDDDEKQSDLNDLDDDFYDDRDKLEAAHREKLSELRREFDEKAASLVRERDQELRTMAKLGREEVEAIAAARKDAFVRREIERLRTEAMVEVLVARGIDPAGEPVIAAEAVDRLGSGAVFTERVDESGGASSIVVDVVLTVDPARLDGVIAQWGLLVPPVPIAIRFSGWDGRTAVPDEAARKVGYLERGFTVSVDGTDVLVQGATYLPAAKVSERLNRLSVAGGEVRSVEDGPNLRVTPFP